MDLEVDCEKDCRLFHLKWGSFNWFLATRNQIWQKRFQEPGFPEVLPVGLISVFCAIEWLVQWQESGALVPERRNGIYSNTLNHFGV